MPNERNLIHCAVYGLLIKDNKVLLLRRFNTGHKDGLLTLPAGHIEKNELPKEAMIRELEEETGIICTTESVISLHAMHRICPNRTYVDYYFEILSNVNPENKEPEKCDHMDWYDIENIPDNTLPNVKTALSFIKNKASISEIREIE